MNCRTTCVRWCFTGAGQRRSPPGWHVDSFAGLTRIRRAASSPLRDMFAAIRTAPVATVCAVTGNCLGVGSSSRWL